MNKNYFFIIIFFTQIVFSQDFSQNTIGLSSNNYPRGLEVTDFNNDNHLDVAIVATNAFPEVAVWLGDGTGNFGAKEIVDNNLTNPTGSLGDDIAVLDVNNDNYLDLVVSVSISYEHKIIWYPNNQDGTFGSRVIIDDGGWRSNHILLFDIDNNGFDDIIMSDRNSTTFTYSLYYLPNQGDGTFGSKMTIVNDGQVQGLDSGFFNNDSFKDLVYTNSFSNSVKVLINNGDGTFASPSTVNNSLTSTNFVNVGRLNNDSLDDLLVSEFNLTETLSSFDGNGDGTFGANSLISGNDFTQIINSEIADIDNDGDNDLISAVQGQSDFVWFENNGNGSFSAPNSISTSSSTNYDVKSGDINEDGKLDIILTNQEGVYWFQNNLTLGINEDELISSINIYPNPSSDFVIIRSENQIINSIQLFDLKGRKIEFDLVDPNKIEIDNLSSGVYIIKIRTDKGTLNRKLIKE
jgi:hypothetical protein